MTANTRMLDRLFPLVDASHADAVTYSIVIPMRYAECVATLRDGRQARLQDPRKFVGWSGSAEQRAFVLHDGQEGAEIRINARRRRQVRDVREVQEFSVLAHDSMAPTRTAELDKSRKIIGRDGDLLYARLQLATGVRDEQATADSKTRIGMEPEPAMEGYFS